MTFLDTSNLHLGLVTLSGALGVEDNVKGCRDDVTKIRALCIAFVRILTGEGAVTGGAYQSNLKDLGCPDMRQCAIEVGVIEIDFREHGACGETIGQDTRHLCVGEGDVLELGGIPFLREQGAGQPAVAVLTDPFDIGKPHNFRECHEWSFLLDFHNGDLSVVVISEHDSGECCQFCIFCGNPVGDGRSIITKEFTGHDGLQELEVAFGNLGFRT